MNEFEIQAAFRDANREKDAFQAAVTRAHAIREAVAAGRPDLAEAEAGRARQLAHRVAYTGSRAEALSMLMHACWPLGHLYRRRFVSDIAKFEQDCNHWRVRRALVDAIARLRESDADLASTLAERVRDEKTRRQAMRPRTTSHES